MSLRQPLSSIPEEAKPVGTIEEDCGLVLLATASTDMLDGRVMSRQRCQQIMATLRRSITSLAAERKAKIIKNCAFAHLCIQDAFQGRLSNGLANNSKKSAWIYFIFCVQTSDVLLNLVLLASALHTFSVFFEPHEQCSRLSLSLQLAALAVYGLDIALKMSYEGMQEYFRHDWQQIYVFNLAVHVIDLWIHGCSMWGNPLRPLAGLLRARRGRKFFDILKKMVPGIAHSMVPILFFVLIAMTFCSAVFHASAQAFASTQYTSYNWLLLILTNDTFNRLLPAELTCNLHYLLFFFPAIFVGQRFLLSLIIGDSYDTFRSFVSKQLRKERLKEIQGLTKAFSALDDRQSGVISEIEWKFCLQALRPDLPAEAVALYFELMVGSHSRAISALQFLSLRKVLQFQLKFTRSDGGWLQATMRRMKTAVREVYCDLTLLPPALTQSKWLREVVDEVLQRVEQWQVLERVSLVDIAALCLADQSTAWPLRLLEVSLHGFYLLEFMMRLANKEGRVAKMSGHMNFVSLSFVLGVAGSLLCQLCLPQQRLVMLSFRMLRCMRQVNLNEDLSDFTAVILDLTPTVVDVLVLTFVLTYMFGMLGQLLFGRVMDEWASPLLAVVKAQQLTYMVDFTSSMEQAMEATHPLASLYFLCFLMLSLTVSNIALSMILDLHANIFENNTMKHRAAQKKKLQLMYDKIVSQAKLRNLCSRSRNKLNFKSIELSEFQTVDVRHFVADEDVDDLSVEDIKACQKYAKVDLLHLFHESHAQRKDLQWEVNLLRALEGSSVSKKKNYSAGKELCRAGDAATELFVVFRGGVRVEVRPSSGPDLNLHSMTMAGSVDVALQPLNLVGSEALQPSGWYQSTVVAAEDTSCFVFSRSDVAAALDNSLCGSLIRLAFKTHAMVQAFANEARKKRRASLRSQTRSPSNSMQLTSLSAPSRESSDPPREKGLKDCS